MGKNLCRCPITESLMRSLGVVEPEVIAETDPRLSSILVSLKIHFFVPYRPPQPLGEQVVIVASFPIHADSGTMLFQESGKGLTLVNWAPWSVLNIFGLPFLRASSRASWWQRSKIEQNAILFLSSSGVNITAALPLINHPWIYPPSPLA